jgi:hypothetical protein
LTFRTAARARAAERGRRLALAASVALALACGSAARTTRSTAPRVPGLPLPPGLDVAVRVDLAALNGELGAPLTQKMLLDAVAVDAVRPQLFERCLSRAGLLWWGLMPPASAAPTEDVVVMRGHFTSLLTDAPGASWSRRPSGVSELDPAQDSAAPESSLYRLPGDELLVWAPRSEAGRIEQAFDDARLQTVLRPPERGAISVAAAPGPLLRSFAARFPNLAAHFSGVQQLEAFAEPTAGAWRAEVSLGFETAAQATQASDVIERLKEALGRGTCAVGVMARSTFISRFEKTLRVQAWLLGADVEVVQACVFGTGCCAG